MQGQEAAGQISGADMLARRDKNWVELYDGEKIERMRQEVKRLMRIVAAHDRGIGALEEHSHGQTGQLLVPMSSRRGQNEASYRRGEDWF